MNDENVDHDRRYFRDTETKTEAQLGSSPIGEAGGKGQIGDERYLQGTSTTAEEPSAPEPVKIDLDKYKMRKPQREVIHAKIVND